MTLLRVLTICIALVLCTASQAFGHHRPGHCRPSHPEDCPATTPTPTPTATPTPTTTPTPTPTPTYAFSDEFNEAAGAPDPSKWQQRCALGGPCYESFQGLAQAKSENVFVDGAGFLHLRVKRESTTFNNGGPFSGAMLGTFQYGWGWPPSIIKASWAVPYHIEMRARFPALGGGWGGAWNTSVDKAQSQLSYELDWAEERTTRINERFAAQHNWQNATDQGNVTCAQAADLTQWHLYSVDATSIATTYKLDGATCMTTWATPGVHGLLLNWGIGLPGSWGSADGSPDPSQPGPWDLVIDYVRVTR